MDRTRCLWVPLDRPLYVEYHDTEWGVPVWDERTLFEMICLEGAQAGLSWWTVLQKREHYRQVFHQFEIEKVAKMTDTALEKLVLDPGIIRHRGKILAFRQNARAWIALREKVGDVVKWLWSFIGGKPRNNRVQSRENVVVTRPESDAMSKALRKAGFNFVGSTTLYAFMQATGMVNDHTAECFCHQAK